MNRDQNIVINRGVAWTTSGRLFNLSSDRENTVLVGDKPPDGITSLKRDPFEICTANGDFRLTRSGTNNSFSNGTVSCGCETPLDPTGGKVTKVEPPKLLPSFVVFTMAPFPPPY